MKFAECQIGLYVRHNGKIVRIVGRMMTTGMVMVRDTVGGFGGPIIEVPGTDRLVPPGELK